MRSGRGVIPLGGAEIAQVDEGTGLAPTITDLAPDAQRLLEGIAGPAMIALQARGIAQVVQGCPRRSPVADFLADAQGLLEADLRLGGGSLLPGDDAQVAQALRLQGAQGRRSGQGQRRLEPGAGGVQVPLAAQNPAPHTESCDLSL